MNYILVENYTTLFKLSANSAHITPRKLLSASGATYYRISYDLVVLFGLTEMQAQLKWIDADVCNYLNKNENIAYRHLEKGIERRSSATVIYDV